ncbi:MAG TPA: hypothetical protein VLL54_17630 [Pyrinomonadaceae bacterium]|nr:hypothetical protein [Pyrinomonadaceae bacterium]
MKANTNNDEIAVDDLSLSEPHFDDERTLLAAQPVVPLQEIKATELRGRRSTLGVAIFCSLLVGFLSATVIYKQRSQKPAEIINSAGPGSNGDDQPAATPALPANNSLSAGIGVIPDSDSRTAEHQSSESLNSATVQSVSPTKATGVRKPLRSERVTPVVRHQPRREAPREARDRRVTPDGVWRIREIFEGSRRP